MTPSTRSLRPQSVTWRSGSTAGRYALWGSGASSSARAMRGRYGSGVPGFTEQVRAAAGHALVRPGADRTYADGDDSTWMQVDWPALTRTVEVLGRRVNVVDTGPPSAATPPTPQTPPT